MTSGKSPEFFRDPAFTAISVILMIAIFWFDGPQGRPVVILVGIVLMLGLVVFRWHEKRNGGHSPIYARPTASTQTQRSIAKWSTRAIGITRWLVVLIAGTVLVVLVGRWVVFEITHNPDACPPEHRKAWVKPYGFPSAAFNGQVSLKNVTQDIELYDVFRCYDLIVHHQDDWFFFSVPSGISIQDAGEDPDNSMVQGEDRDGVLVDNGMWEFEGHAGIRHGVPLYKNHTYFIQDNGHMVRLHLGGWDSELRAYISYLPEGGNRFHGLTQPWYVRPLEICGLLVFFLLTALFLLLSGSSNTTGKEGAST